MDLDNLDSQEPPAKRIKQEMEGDPLQCRKRRVLESGNQKKNLEWIAGLNKISKVDGIS